MRGPVALRAETNIIGYRALGPLPCQGCGKLVHIVRRWHGLFVADIDKPGSIHRCP